MITAGSPTLVIAQAHKIIIGWRERLVFLLPFVAGIALVITGIYIRGMIPELKEVFAASSCNLQEVEVGTSNGR